jgi:hypothetical protein
MHADAGHRPAPYQTHHADLDKRPLLARRHRPQVLYVAALTSASICASLVGGVEAGLPQKRRLDLDSRWQVLTSVRV